MSEYTEVEQPFLEQLKQQGWITLDQGDAIPQDPAQSLRHSFGDVVLPDIFKTAVRKLNLLSTGKPWLSNAQTDELLDQLRRFPTRSLLESNEEAQKWLFKAQVAENTVTGESDPVVQLIDFANPEKNTFHAINQFRIDTPGSVKSFIIPDIVLFVNGLPLVVVECKKAGPNCANPMSEAFIQLQRYMGRREETARDGLKEGESRLFHTNLMVVRSSFREADYGTITSVEEHFYPWKTQWPAADDAADERSAQERLISGMLTKANLVSLLRHFSVFVDTDGGPRIKIVSRYQQFRAANKIVEKLRSGGSVEERSGVVWHTQGSGKSLTMVFVARMIRASGDLADYKILLINDRNDLEDQLGETAKAIGGRTVFIDSSHKLREELSRDTSNVNLVMVHKFQIRDAAMPVSVATALGTNQAIPSAQRFGEVNASDRILLMIDEAHRTQGSDLGDNVFEAFPNAARIAFTGTPLITERHGERKTVKRFGEYIDTYRLMDAVDDGVTLQILYEGRTADTALNDRHDFDTKFENLFKDRTEEEILAIKKKYGATGDILEAEERIKATARDMVRHYLSNIFPNGFKAQVVCHSKRAAWHYLRAIRAALAEEVVRLKAVDVPDQDLISRVEFLKAAAVVSSDGTNEAAYVRTMRDEARKLNAVDNFCKSFRFDDPEQENSGIAFLIVCDMLLTGFDAPIEQVMYLDKKLSEHTLLQAIARTNRVKRGKQRGFVVDYVGLTENLTEALKLYARTDELEELRDGLKSITSEVPVLEERFQRLIQLFETNKVTRVRGFVRGELSSVEEEAAVVHAAVSLLKDEKLRADFDVYLKKFLSSLDVILPNSAGHDYRIPAKRFGYIQRVARERYRDETLQLGDAGAKVRKLIDEHLISLGISPAVPPVELLDEDFIARLNQNARANDEAKASEMEHAIRKHCTIHHEKDPVFYKKLSEKVDTLIQQHQSDWTRLAEELEKLRSEALQGRQERNDGMSTEAATFYDLVVQEAGEIDPRDQRRVRELMEEVIGTLEGDLPSIDYWSNPDMQKRTRASIKTAIMDSGIDSLKENRERVVIEVMNLAKNRHDQLLRGRADTPEED